MDTHEPLYSADDLYENDTERDEPRTEQMSELFEGKTFGQRYRLDERIAIGGMGEVWKATDTHTDTPVAIKVLRPKYAGEEHFLSRLRVEAANASTLDHPHLARVFDSGEQDGLGWIVMELVHGYPMTRLLREHKIVPLTILLPILRQTALALSAVHSAGIVHRDIKPGNILLNAQGDVKLTDFGISRSQNQVTLTAAGMVMGTAQYLSPEQAIGKPATPAGDLYAIGVIAYEALCGHRPFTGKSQVDIAFAHVNSPVKPLPDSVPAALRTLVMRLLDKNPARRPATAAKLAYQLSELEFLLLGQNSSSEATSSTVHTPITSLAGGTVLPPAQMPRSFPIASLVRRTRLHQSFPSIWRPVESVKSADKTAETADDRSLSWLSTGRHIAPDHSARQALDLSLKPAMPAHARFSFMDRYGAWIATCIVALVLACLAIWATFQASDTVLSVPRIDMCELISFQSQVRNIL